jgi:hypothetical protein
MLLQVVLEPDSALAGGTRVFRVKDVQFDTSNGHCVLALRDGKMCLGLVGGWKITVGPCNAIVAHTLAQAEEIHSGEQKILLAN